MRLEARGLARALFAMAATLAVVSVAAVMLSLDTPPTPAPRIAVGHGVLVALFTASGMLFRHASLTVLK